MSYEALIFNKEKDFEIVKMDEIDRMVEMKHSGICGTDKHVILGQFDIELPVIMGHENVGVFEERRITWPTIIPCNSCVNCKIGMENICKRNKLFGITTRDPLSGGWAEKSHLPEDTAIFDIPDEIPDDIAVLIETMASTKSLRSVDLSGKNILIIGSGPIGMLSAVHAKSMGANIVGVTGHKNQANLVKKSIDEFYEKEIPVEQIESEYDIVMDAGGNETSLAYCINAAKPRGTILESGCMTKGMMFDMSKLVKKELTVHTQLGYVPSDFPWAIEMVKDNLNYLKDVISHRFRLKDHQKMVDTIKNEKHGKIIFSMD